MLKRKEIEELRDKYPRGTQVELVEMRGEEGMKAGMKGSVNKVDDIGQIHVSWENGSVLALNTEEDIFHIVKPELKPYEKKMDEFLDRANEVVREVDMKQLNLSANGPDKTLAHDTLEKMQKAFESVYGSESVGRSEEYVLAPAIFRGKKSGVISLGLVVLDLQSSGEHCESIFLTPTGIVHQGDMYDNPRIKEYLNEYFIPYEYWYTPAIENDIHVDFEHVPKEIQELAGELFQNQQDGPSMNME